MGAPFGNLFALGANSGVPRFYETPDEMAVKLNEYFEWVKGEKGTDVGPDGKLEEWKRQPENITITGLCIYLGFESRQSFYDYGKKNEFAYIIARARLLVENGYENKLHNQHVQGPIFALKNMGWADKTELTGTNGEALFPGKVIVQQVSGLPEVKEEEDV